MSPIATGTGISLGKVALIVGIVVVGGIIYFAYKNNDKQSKQSNKSMKKLLDDDDIYNTYKTIIDEAIQVKDWQTLEDFLDSRAKKYPDLIQMIKKALNNR